MTRQGFTIIELLIVVTIIGLLLGAVALNVAASQANSRDARRVGDITLYAKALDAAQFTSRGKSPHKVGGGSDEKFCANQLDPSYLDLSIFPHNALPQDPRPANSNTTCSSMVNGYTFHTSTSNLAQNIQAKYALEFGLEKEHIYDEKTLKTPLDLDLNTTTYPAQENNRFRYLLPGPR